MALDNSIGSVSVDIRGDYSRLQADFAAAQGLAAKAGAGIASSLTTGMAPAAGGASLVLDKYGVAFRSITAAAVPAAAAVAATGAAAAASVPKISAAQAVVNELRLSLLANAGAVETQGVAMGHGATQIQAVGGALRTAFGEQSIRAVERFLTMIPGVGPLLQKAFPLIGAIALYEMFSRLMEKSEGVKAAMGELKTATEAVDKAFADLVRTGDQLMTHAMTRDTGAAAGAQQRANELRRQARDLDKDILQTESEARNAANVYNAAHPGETVFKGTLTGPQYESEEVVIERQKLNKKLEQLRTEQDAKLKEANSAELDAGKSKQEQLGALDSARIANQKSAGDKASELLKIQLNEQSKLEHDAQTQRIAGLASEYDRVVQTGQEEIRYARQKQTDLNAVALGNLDRATKEIGQQFGAESQGKSTEEKDKLKIQAQGKLADAQAEYKKVAVESQNTVSDAVSKSALSVIEMNQRVKESLRSLNESWTATVLSMRRAPGETTVNANQGTEAAKDTNRLIDERADKAIAANQKISEIEAKGKGPLDSAAIQKQKLQYEQVYAAAVIHTNAEQLANAQKLASFDARERAVKIDDLNASLKLAQADVGAGVTDKQLAAKEEVARLTNQIAEAQAKSDNDDIAAQTKILELKIRQSYAGQVKAQIGDGSVIDKSTTAAANFTTQAVDGIAGALARAAVQGKHLGDIFVNLGKQLAQSALTSVLKIGLDAVLKSLLSLVPAFGTVAAAQAGAAATAKATTSATDLAEAEGNIGVAATGAAAAVAWIPIVGPALAEAAAATMFGTLQPYAALAAFAEGGRPPLGIASIVGERGPELFIPDQAGQIIPAGKFGGAGVGLPNISGVSSSSSSQSIGELHVHAHGITNPKEFVRQVARELPNYLKHTSPAYSPASR